MQTGVPVTEQGYDSILQSDSLLWNKKSGTADFYSSLLPFGRRGVFYFLPIIILGGTLP